MWWDVLGGLIVTYFLSRAALALLRIKGLPRLALVHAGCWLLIAIVTGMLRRNDYSSFDVHAGFVYLPGTLLWLIVDSVRVSGGNLLKPKR